MDQKLRPWRLVSSVRFIRAHTWIGADALAQAPEFEALP
jgi:hypothetical protein